MAEPALLRATDLAYEVAGRPLVRDIAFEAEAGSMRIVVGPNGAGKSTLLRLLSGELRPSRGEVAYEGLSASGIPPWRLAALRAVMPQAARLAFPFTAAEVVRIGLDGIGRGLDRRQRDRILTETMRLAEIEPLAGRAYPSLSGGEQARVQFARALCQLAAGRSVAGRQVLLLDEPTASLDLRHQTALLEAACGIARSGAAVIAILHDLNLAAAYADILTVMQAGRIVASGTPDEVMRDDLITGIFGLRWRVGDIPEPRRPFILPRRRVAQEQQA